MLAPLGAAHGVAQKYGIHKSWDSMNLQQKHQLVHLLIRHDKWVVKTQEVHKWRTVQYRKHNLVKLEKLNYSIHRQLRPRPVAPTRSLASTSGVPAWFRGVMINSIYPCENAGYGWSANTGNGYYGGLQMDYRFQQSYGKEFLYSIGTADKWSPDTQILVAWRAYHSGRGFYPWPTCARRAGLI